MANSMHMLLVLSLLTFWLAHPVAAAQPSDETKSLRLSVLEVTGGSYPYQSHRIRLKLTNIADQPVGPLVGINTSFHLHLRASGGETSKSVNDSILIFDRNKPRVEGNQGPQLMKLILDPGDETSVSFAIAASWVDNEGRLPIDKGKPLFPKPGKYSLLVRYYPFSEAGKIFLEAASCIEVKPPTGIDNQVYELLKENPRLASVILRPVDPPPKDLVEKLNDCVGKYDKSSYGPYFRFALARWHLYGDRYNPVGGRTGMARAAELLVPIMNDRFPYQPQLLLTLRWIDFHQDFQAAMLLRNQHADSLEWLEEAAGAMSPDEWTKFRKRKVEEKKAGE